MGGHGGLNILPQKRWNVYNFDNRERVRRDEEAAAREEQLKQEQARRRDAEFRLEKLRQATRAKRGFESHDPSELGPSQSEIPGGEQCQEQPAEKEQVEDRSNFDSKHINLFDGWNGFQMEGENKEENRQKEKRKSRKEDEEKPEKKKKRRKEEEQQSVRAVLPEDEKYRLGYGVVGKDAKTPWYLSKSFMAQDEEEQSPGERRSNSKGLSERHGEKAGKKKSLQELREERLKRERKERERAQKLLFPSTGDSRLKPDVFGRNCLPYYNSGYGNAR